MTTLHFITIAGLWWYDNSNRKQTGRGVWIGSDVYLCVHDQRLSFFMFQKAPWKPSSVQMERNTNQPGNLPKCQSIHLNLADKVTVHHKYMSLLFKK